MASVFTKLMTSSKSVEKSISGQGIAKGESSTGPGVVAQPPLMMVAAKFTPTDCSDSVEQADENAAISVSGRERTSLKGLVCERS